MPSKLLKTQNYNQIQNYGSVLLPPKYIFFIKYVRHTISSMYVLLSSMYFLIIKYVRLNTKYLLHNYEVCTSYDTKYVLVTITSTYFILTSKYFILTSNYFIYYDVIT